MLRLAALALASALVLPLAPRAQTGPPNVLFVSIDDLNTAVGFLSEEPGNPLQMLYPDPAVRAQVRAVLSPNLDRLAADGVAFANAHASSAICAPSRAALMTGVRTSTSGFYGGTWFRFNEMLATVPTLPEHFRANGYYTAGVGKIFHINRVYLGPDGEIAADMPDSQRSWTDWVNRDVGRGGATTWSPWSPGQDRLEFGVSSAPLEGQNDYMNGDLMARLIEDGTSSIFDVTYQEEKTLALPQDAPFFLAVGLYRPHVPLVVAQEFLDLFDPADMALTDSLREALIADLADVSDAAKAVMSYDDGVITDGRMKYLIDHAAAIDSVNGPLTAWKDLVRHYLASVAQSDRILGHLLDALDASPYAENTAVVVWGDHGWHLGEKGWFGKTMLWDESTRTTLIIRPPGSGGALTPAPLRRQPVSLVDVYPTLAAMAGLPIPEHAEGADLAPLFDDPAAAPVSTALTTMGLDDHTLLSTAHRYLRFDDSLGEEELYDVVVDPDERTNLVDDPAYAADLQAMRAAMDDALVPPPPPTNAVTITGGEGYRMLTVGAEGLTVGALAVQNLVAGLPGQYAGEPLTLQTRFDGRDWQAPASLADPLTPGHGMWWYFHDDTYTPPGTGVGRSVALPFTLTGGGRPEITSDVTVTLHSDGARYNALGNPFGVPLDLRTMETWAGAEHIKPKGFVWDADRSKWTLGRTAPPWVGFAVRANRRTGGETLTIPYPTATKAASVTPPTEPRIAFELAGADAETARPLEDGALALAFAEAGAPGLDDLDFVKLAPLSARHVALGARVEGTLLAEDVRPPASAEIPLALASVGAAPELELRWDLTALPAHWSLTLYDAATGTDIDLRRASSYAFRAGSAPAGTPDAPAIREMGPDAATVRFVLRVETEPGASLPGLAAAEVALLPVAPNPASAGTHIAFELPDDAEVSVSVFDARGREVAVLAQGLREAGRHVLVWDASRAAPGVYVVRMETGGQVLVRRALVVR